MLKLLLLPIRMLVLFFRLAGAKGGALFIIGVAVGLLIAPQTGPELRARLQAKLAAPGGGLPPEQDIAV